MVKRTKRIEKGAESIKEEIENHFIKIEQDILEGNADRGRYHIKEIDRSLLNALEIKLKLLGIEDDDSVRIFRERLENLKRGFELNEF